MTISVKTLFLGIFIAMSSLLSAHNVPSEDGVAGGIASIVQTGLTAEVHLDRSQLPPRLQNKLARVILTDENGVRISRKFTFGDMVTFSTAGLPDGDYTVILRVQRFSEAATFSLEE